MAFNPPLFVNYYSANIQRFFISPNFLSLIFKKLSLTRVNIVKITYKILSFYIIYMDISIENNGKTEDYKLINSWSDVTVEKYARLVQYNKLSGSQKSLHTIALCTNIPKSLVKKLDVVSLGSILSMIQQLQEEDTDVYTTVFKHEGIRYGMIPDLSAITLGEYVDLESYITRDTIGNLCEIASILFRPIIRDDGNTYVVEAYDSNSAVLRAKTFKTLSSTQVTSALVFFWTLGSGLLKGMGLFSETLIEEMR